MSNIEDDDDYQFLRIIDALHSINQKVNLIGVVAESGISKQSRGTGNYFLPFIFLLLFIFINNLCTRMLQWCLFPYLSDTHKEKVVFFEVICCFCLQDCIFFAKRMLQCHLFS